MNVEELVEAFEAKGLSTRVQRVTAGVHNPVERQTLWVTVPRDRLEDTVSDLIEMTDHLPHFSVISPSDEGETIDVNYHFTVNYGGQLEEIVVTFKVSIPKDDCWVPTLTGLMPATAFSEREIIEMMGIDVRGLEDKRHLFLTENFPQGVYPWRRDSTGATKLNKLYEGWKE
jgi:membrane-bound hydrogenase subunit beta